MEVESEWKEIKKYVEDFLVSWHRLQTLDLTLTNCMFDVINGIEPEKRDEILKHHEGFYFIPGNKTLSALEVNLVNVMSCETVLTCSGCLFGCRRYD